MTTATAPVPQPAVAAPSTPARSAAPETDWLAEARRIVAAQAGRALSPGESVALARVTVDLADAIDVRDELLSVWLAE